MDDQRAGGHDRGCHARHGRLVAAPGRCRVVHQMQAEHEARRCRQVNQLDDGVECPAHEGSPARAGALPFGLASMADDAAAGATRRLNILSILPVTTYPPTTFIAANATATKARAYPMALCAAAAITMAPASTMPWIEFAADMSGVCSVAGTLLITSKPTHRLRTKMMKYVSSMFFPRSLGRWLIGRVRGAGIGLRERGMHDLALVCDHDAG